MCEADPVCGPRAIRTGLIVEPALSAAYSIPSFPSSSRGLTCSAREVLDQPTLLKELRFLFLQMLVWEHLPMCLSSLLQLHPYSRIFLVSLYFQGFKFHVDLCLGHIAHAGQRIDLLWGYIKVYRTHWKSNGLEIEGLLQLCLCYLKSTETREAASVARVNELQAMVACLEGVATQDQTIRVLQEELEGKEHAYSCAMAKLELHVVEKFKRSPIYYAAMYYAV
ncbi:hypothetical protein Q3G72_027273 [Acer saccharum]|nr:hypothetical protein Q3G72_027273 [Acer saccharum]